LLRKVISPQSKQNNSIPYAYLAKVFHTGPGIKSCSYCYGDRLCRIISHLKKNEIRPLQVKIFGLFRNEEIEINIKICTDRRGNWLMTPELCRSMEKCYLKNPEKIYYGHFKTKRCNFYDREGVII
jgi:hypothetical protein